MDFNGWPRWAVEMYDEKLAILQADEVPDAEALVRSGVKSEMLRRARSASDEREAKNLAE